MRETLGDTDFFVATPWDETAITFNPLFLSLRNPSLNLDDINETHEVNEYPDLVSEQKQEA